MPPGAPPSVLPARVRDALWRLDAPEGLDTVPQVVAWALEDLTFTLTCGIPLGATTTKGSIRHLVRVNPLTGQTGPSGGDRQPEKVEAHHFLWALGHPEPPACVEAGLVLSQWVGNLNPDRVAPWPKPRMEEMRAVRTLMRLVTYTAADLDPLDHPRWFEVAATPGNIRHLHATVDAHGLDLRRVEGRIFSQVSQRIGGPGRPYTGSNLCPVAADIDEAIDTWCRNHASKHR